MQVVAKCLVHQSIDGRGILYVEQEWSRRRWIPVPLEAYMALGVWDRTDDQCERGTSYQLIQWLRSLGSVSPC